MRGEAHVLNHRAGRLDVRKALFAEVAAIAHNNVDGRIRHLGRELAEPSVDHRIVDDNQILHLVIAR